MKINSKSKHKIHRLGLAFQLCSSRDEAHLNEITSSINSIEREIEDLRKTTYTDLERLAFDGSFIVPKYQHWVELRIRKLNLQIASLLVQEENAKIKLTLSLGRKEVIKKILR